MANLDSRFELKALDHPMGKGFTVSLQGGGGDVASLAKHARIEPKEAREILKSLVDKISDHDLNNFLGAQLSVVS